MLIQSTPSYFEPRLVQSTLIATPTIILVFQETASQGPITSTTFSAKLTVANIPLCHIYAPFNQRAGASQLVSIQSNETLSVTQLNTLAKDILESSFPHILVEGEISNLAQPRSGHIYFTLKDSRSQIRAAMFAGNKRRLKFQPEEGQKVLVKAKLSLYAPRGDYQLIVSQMEEAGEGALRRAFEALKQKLEDKGWFNEDNKKPIPSLCKHIAVISSPSGAAIQDILHVLERRFPATKITLLPSLVQGKEASRQLAAAVKQANQLKLSGQAQYNFDAILLARGGGSLEDLWPFNEENLALEIYNSALPLVTGVGHETDYTIADWVSDYRAPTPSAAAEMLSPDQDEYAETFLSFNTFFKNHISQVLMQHQQSLDWLSKQNKHPGKKLNEQSQYLQDLKTRLIKTFEHSLHNKQHSLNTREAQLSTFNPLSKIQHAFYQVSQSSKFLNQAIKQKLSKESSALSIHAGRLNAISPLATLSRGYSISRLSQHKENSKNDILRQYNQVKVGDEIKTRLFDGEVRSRVISAEPLIPAINEK